MATMLDERTVSNLPPLDMVQDETRTADDAGDYAVFEDGLGTPTAHGVNLRHHNLNGSRLYIDSGRNSGTAHLFEDDLDRTDALTAFLGSLDGRPYLIRLVSWREDCVVQRWVTIEEAFFSTAADLDAFKRTFNVSGATGKQTPRRTSEAVTKLRYTREEANVEWSRIDTLAAERNWSARKVAAYKANVSRRVSA